VPLIYSYCRFNQFRIGFNQFPVVGFAYVSVHLRNPRTTLRTALGTVSSTDLITGARLTNLVHKQNLLKFKNNQLVPIMQKSVFRRIVQFNKFYKIFIFFSSRIMFIKRINCLFKFKKSS